MTAPRGGVDLDAVRAAAGSVPDPEIRRTLAELDLLDTVEADGGRLELGQGGAALRIDGVEKAQAPEREYPEIYRRFAALIRARESDVDARPLRIIADALLIGRRETTAEFHD